MANPLDAFKGLKPWQQGAVIAGSVGVIGLAVYQHRKAKKTPAIASGTPAAAAASGVASTAGDVQDPTTGQQYPIDAIDPNSGLPYGQEIAEYGSVSAADATAGAGYQAASQGITPQEYVEQTGGTGTGATSGSTVTTNAQWMAEVETGLSEQNYTASDIGQGLAAYFASKPLGTSSDGTNLYTMMNLAISEYGPPPTGSYPLLIAGSTPPPTPPPGGGHPQVPEVSGGHVVSLSANDAQIAWTGANAASYRLVIHGPGKINGRESTVSAPHASYAGLEAGHDYQVTVTPVGKSGATGKPGTIAFKTTGGKPAPKTKIDGKPAAKQ